jgi:uncharacterized protein YbjT (DUF2867 family)
MEFFTASTGNLLKYEEAAGVTHHIALSVVGTDRLAENGSGYMRAKIAQEKLIKESPIPYTIVHATQFFEFSKAIADAATTEDTVRLAPVPYQPIAADDVAKAVEGVAIGPPLNTTIEIAGPEVFRFDELIKKALAARSDPREVVPDAEAPYFGALLNETSLVPGKDARLGATRFDDWLAAQPAPTQTAKTAA